MELEVDGMAPQMTRPAAFHFQQEQRAHFPKKHTRLGALGNRAGKPSAEDLDGSQ